ncbi:hypothetical protein HBI56_083830 [Parastagonospora nodorum]|nr:hypothetical protein HBI10_118750 [Parastagonospora nodorum]KAH4025180.1 hypothetical protein HBI13_078440 [Parastagonospora nodorum]KAH4032532.1 hypothetical protein HBI09_120080 [Parastagonospora nodorum]KAH4191371.1 hypothetical protein HBH42_124510 [Parastagonospora nodorum]KAH4206213.1 hypothetical protein HBI95_125530 [Parastagonospora nodorum]
MFARLITRSTRSVRFNSSSSSSSAARVMQMAAQAERPNATEAAVPVMWAVCGALTYTAWNRMDERTAGGNVEKLIIV